MKKHRVIIAGGRNCPLSSRVLGLVTDQLSLLGDKSEVELISGTARGADQIPYLIEGYGDPTEFPAKWDELGTKAGPIRNGEMANYATHLILVWDGKSRGSADMLRRATAMRLKVKQFKYKLKEQ